MGTNDSPLLIRPGTTFVNAKTLTVVTVTATAVVIIASATKLLGSSLGWVQDVDRLGIVSGLSLTNLLLISLLSLGVTYRRIRGHTCKIRDWFDWLIIGIGTLYLFADNVLGVNEWIETKVERGLGITDTRWTQHIDDVLIAFGGMIGISVIIYCRRAFSRPGESASLFGTAIVLLSAMMLLDLSTDQLAHVVPEFGHTELTKLARGAIELLEDTLMLVGEAMLVVGTFIILRTSRQGRNQSY